MAAQAAAHEAAIAEESRIRQEETARQQAVVQQQIAQMYSNIQGLSVQIGQPLPPDVPSSSGFGSSNSSCEPLDNLVLSFQVLET